MVLLIVVAALLDHVHLFQKLKVHVNYALSEVGLSFGKLLQIFSLNL